MRIAQQRGDFFPRDTAPAKSDAKTRWPIGGDRQVEAVAVAACDWLTECRFISFMLISASGNLIFPPKRQSNATLPLNCKTDTIP